MVVKKIFAIQKIQTIKAIDKKARRYLHYVKMQIGAVTVSLHPNP